MSTMTKQWVSPLAHVLLLLLLAFIIIIYYLDTEEILDATQKYYFIVQVELSEVPWRSEDIAQCYSTCLAYHTQCPVLIPSTSRKKTRGGKTEIIYRKKKVIWVSQ